MWVVCSGITNWVLFCLRNSNIVCYHVCSWLNTLYLSQLYFIHVPNRGMGNGTTSLSMKLMSSPKVPLLHSIMYRVVFLCKIRPYEWYCSLCTNDRRTSQIKRLYYATNPSTVRNMNTYICARLLPASIQSSPVI